MDVVIPEIGTLHTSLKAARAINARFGSLRKALDSLAGFDLDGCIFIVAAGLDKKMTEVEDKVYEIGTADLAGPLSDYVVALVNGGKPMKETTPGE